MSRTERLAAFFRAHPNVWISALDLMPIAGTLSWRSRVSDVRHAPHCLNIENRVRTVHRDDGSSYTVSEYRCVVTKMTDQSTLNLDTEDKKPAAMPSPTTPRPLLF